VKNYTYYNNSNRLKEDGKYGYVWDRNGNLTEKGTHYTLNGEEMIFDSEEGEYWKYEYDLLNRMTAVYKSDGGKDNKQLVAEYTYDADNYRVKKDSVEEGITYFIFGLNGEVLYEEEQC
jgi:hypothetical protein